MRTRRSIIAVVVLALTLTTGNLFAATRDTRPVTQPERPSIVTKIKLLIIGVVRAFDEISIPKPT